MLKLYITPGYARPKKKNRPGRTSAQCVRPRTWAVKRINKIYAGMDIWERVVAPVISWAGSGGYRWGQLEVGRNNKLVRDYRTVEGAVNPALIGWE